jgi:hypothetical protein
MLLSPLVLQDKGLQIQWTSDHGFKFYDNGVLKLFSIRWGKLLIAPIFLCTVETEPLVIDDPSDSVAVVVDTTIQDKVLAYSVT